MDDAIENYLNQKIIDGKEAYLKAHEKKRFMRYAPHKDELE